ncbi:type IX secretion system sortase PorU [Chitinophaga sp. Cy-1792]|uniref:type IX secretion system sortase PorU n=1 Tax=Chitinophaga sp. Cy-1792 TaxID=2608339 RepID=UPI0021077589|nr:type IX secretion system sortase PorU [Chitinophaga sp. Cy-1792]NIG52012.1 type IX secretion system sortase PorU [Chitinophaga sp. Cy-1792]
MKLPCIYILFLLILLIGNSLVIAQPYTNHSVLSSGNWYKLAVGQSGVYRLDAAFLKKIGLNPDQVKASQIQLYGNHGRMLPENNLRRPDDLQQIALFINDGGDNIINGNDYILFYTPGPHQWIYNNSSSAWLHQYNIYSDSAWFFLTVGPEATSLRIQQETQLKTPQQQAYSFDYHTFYENDSLNFLRSGKQWYAEEFSLDPTAGSRHSYKFSLPGIPQGPVTVNMRVAARGVNGSNFQVSLNKQAAATAYLLPVSGNVFESFATAATGTGGVYISDSIIKADVDFLQGDNNARGWLDYLEIIARCPLQIPPSGMLEFRNDRTQLNNNITGYYLYNASEQTQIWDVTDLWKPVMLRTRQAGDSMLCTVAADIPREMLAFDPVKAPQPVAIGKIANQDLHAVSARMIIATVPALYGPASRLAQWHTQQGLPTTVITMDQVYNEFASGSPDPTALRDFLRMQYVRGEAPAYLLLFGAASYDYRQRIKNNTNMVPSWQSTASLDPVSSYVSDDYFGLLQENDDISRTDIRNELQVSIGRIPARNATEAATVVDKIINYREKANQGDWRNRLIFIADDEDNNLHLDDAEYLTQQVGNNAPSFNINKIYLDAYQRTTAGGAPQYPAAVKELNRRINLGALMVNYTGHGSNTRLAEENVVDANTITQWNNEDRLPLLLTATCDFAPFDNPAVYSPGQQLLLQRPSGAIALMTTTRAVFAASNKIMNSNYITAAFTRTRDGNWKSLGEAAREAKNLTYAAGSDLINNRKFQLLGDPALTLAYPQWKVVIDSIDGQQPGTDVIALAALRPVKIAGHLEDEAGNSLPDYNGILSATIFGVPVKTFTLGNTAGSIVVPFLQQDNVIFRGTQTISAGKFSMSVMIPSDAVSAGQGKISLYASGGMADATGYNVQFSVNSIATGEVDHEGPVIQAWINNRQFVNGDKVGPDVILLADIQDPGGINILGRDTAHNILALLDNTEYIALNDYFSASLGSYSEGTVAFPLLNLTAGPHTVVIKAWDSYNNASGKTIDFVVTEKGTVALDDVACYPNPFHDQTKFVFTHNQQGQTVILTIQVFDLSGKLMKTLRDTIIPGSNRFDGMPWDGTGDSGARLSPGLYLYRLTISSNGKKKVKGGKVVFF